MIVKSYGCYFSEAHLLRSLGGFREPRGRSSGPGCPGSPGASWERGEGLGALSPARAPSVHTQVSVCPSEAAVHLWPVGHAARVRGRSWAGPASGTGPGSSVWGRASPRRPHGAGCVACAPPQGPALCNQPSLVPSRRCFHQPPPGQDLRAGAAERGLHAPETDDGEAGGAGAGAAPGRPLLAEELRGLPGGAGLS